MTRDPDAERDLRDALAFFGALTASVTHELNNVFGTIDQIAGLLEDLTHTHSQGEKISSERLGTVAERIVRQAERGATLTRRLNLFAHSPDETVSEFSLSEAIQNLVYLMDRTARMRRTELSLRLPDADVLVRSDRFVILRIVFCLVQKIISVAARNTAVEIAIATQGDSVLATIAASCEGSPEDVFVGDQVWSLAATVSGRIEKVIENGCVRLEFGFPARCDTP